MYWPDNIQITVNKVCLLSFRYPGRGLTNNFTCLKELDRFFCMFIPEIVWMVIQDSHSLAGAR